MRDTVRYGREMSIPHNNAARGGREERVVAGGRPLKTHGQLVADHNDTFDVGITASVIKKRAGIHVAEVQLVREIFKELVYYSKVGFPAGLVFVIQ